MFVFSLSAISLDTSILHVWPFFILAILGSVPLYKDMSEMIIKKFKIGEAIIDIYLLLVFVLSIMFLLSSSYNPFIYFRF